MLAAVLVMTQVPDRQVIVSPGATIRLAPPAEYTPIKPTPEKLVAAFRTPRDGRVTIVAIPLGKGLPTAEEVVDRTLREASSSLKKAEAKSIGSFPNFMGETANLFRVAGESAEPVFAISAYKYKNVVLAIALKSPTMASINQELPQYFEFVKSVSLVTGRPATPSKRGGRG